MCYVDARYMFPDMLKRKWHVDENVVTASTASYNFEKSGLARGRKFVDVLKSRF